MVLMKLNKKEKKEMHQDNNTPHLIEFPKIGKPELGFISIAEKENLPFVPKRIYWTYFTPEDVERGGHSHYDLHQILVTKGVNNELPLTRWY